MQQLAELKRQELAASINVERAIATLDEAKLNYHASAVRTQHKSIRLSNPNAEAFLSRLTLYSLR